VKSFFPAILILLISSSSFAQRHLIGISTGVSLTNVRANEDYLQEAKDKKSFTFGLTYEYQGKKNFNYGVDVVYYQRGFQSKLSIPQLEYISIVESDDKLIHSYNYIALPLKCGFSTKNKFAPFINVGIIPSFVLNAKTSTEAEIVVEYWDSEFNRDVSDYITNFDLAGLVEVGTNIQVSERTLLGVSFSYQQSATTISNSNYHYGTEMRNYGLAVALGLKYVFEKNQ
jgi:outer membrane protein W